MEETSSRPSKQIWQKLCRTFGNVFLPALAELSTASVGFCPKGVDLTFFRRCDCAKHRRWSIWYAFSACQAYQINKGAQGPMLVPGFSKLAYLPLETLQIMGGGLTWIPPPHILIGPR